MHLGSRDCKAVDLLEFLDNTDADTLYLLGDAVDFWTFKTGLYWPILHGDVVQRIISKAKNGSNVVYIPGHHDTTFRHYAGMSFNGITIANSNMHTTIDGRKFQVLPDAGWAGIALDKGYCNGGDWGKNATVLVENSVGQLSLLHWPTERQVLLNTAKAPAVTQTARLYSAVENTEWLFFSRQ